MKLQRTQNSSPLAANTNLAGNHPARIDSNPSSSFGIRFGLVLTFFTSTLLAQPVPSGNSTSTETPPPVPKKTTTAPVELAKTVVTATADTQTPPTPEAVAVKLTDIAGGTSLVNSDDVTRGRVLTAQDVLAYQPGVYAQAADGNDAIKISIRGSSVDRGTGYFRSGILFLLDGLPVTGPGGTPFELLEPLGLSYTEVLRGANAFEYGPVELGGAINYVTNTGYSAPGALIHLEGGSFGYVKGQVADGGIYGKADYYVSLTQTHRDGFQPHSVSNNAGVASNFGYRFNSDVDTRVFFRYRTTYFKYPGSLTRAQIEQDASQGDTSSAADGGAIAIDAARKQQGSTWIADKTTVKITPDSKLEVGLVFHDYPIEIDYGAKSVWYFGDATVSARYTRSDDFSIGKSDTTIAVNSTTHIYAGVNTYGAGPGAGFDYGKYNVLEKSANYNGSADNVILISNDLQAAKDFWVTTGLSGINVKRNNNITYSTTTAVPDPQIHAQPPKYDQSHSYLAPRLGFRYNATPDIQVFGNISRSIEPQNSWAFSGGSYAGQNYNYSLRDQRAWASEIGTRAKVGIFTASVSYYHTDVRDEILSIRIAPNVTDEANASPTTHQGLEVGLETELWQAGTGANNSKLTWRQAYTWSDFHYNNDSVFGRAKLPGLPPHFYQAELIFQHESGFYVGINTQAASRYAADYANSIYTDSYVIFGASAGYRSPKKGWEVYVDLRNLTNKGYAASVSPDYNDGGTDQRVSDPGDGFGVNAGVTFRY